MTTFVVKRPTRFARIFQVIRELCSSPLGTFSFVIVLLFFAVGITADYITPYDPIKIDIRNKLSGPSWDHWLGTDQLGRDVFSRLIVGTKMDDANSNENMEALKREATVLNFDFAPCSALHGGGLRDVACKVRNLL